MTDQSEFSSAPGWSTGRIELLRRHHAAGLTARQSAAILGGVTRHAVISKRHRIGLKCPRAPAAILAALHPIVRARLRLVDPPLLRIRPLPQMDLPPPADAAPKSLNERGPRQCAWPLGPAEAEGDYLTLFCCAPRQGRRPYCATHSAIARATDPQAQP